MGWLLILAVLYVAFMVYRDYKKKSYEGFTVKGLWGDIKEAKFSHYVAGFLMFLLVFMFARGFAIGQTLAQTCEVWESGLPSSYKTQNIQWGNVTLEGEPTKTFVVNEWTGNIDELEQGRSYNYYRRYFNSHGGRPVDIVNINCTWNIERFIKNIELDYLEVEGLK